MPKLKYYIYICIYFSFLRKSIEIGTDFFFSRNRTGTVKLKKVLVPNLYDKCTNTRFTI